MKSTTAGSGAVLDKIDQRILVRLQEDGRICVATLVNGGITVISPDGRHVEHRPMPDPMTTNICFGGSDRKTAYITLSWTGRLVAVDWPTAGLRLNQAG